MWKTGNRRFQRLLEINNEAEAQLLTGYLTERGVPHIIQSYHDSAYGSLFQSQMVAWGYLEAPKEFESIVQQVYADITAPPDAIGETSERDVFDALDTRDALDDAPKDRKDPEA